MSKRLLVIIMTILLTILIFAPFASAADVTLTLSTEIAIVGDSITAAGTADADTWVSIKVLNEDQNIVFFDAVKAGADGCYTKTFPVPDVAEGILTIVAGYGDNVAVRTLTIGTPTSQVSLNLSAYTGLVGDSITATGTADADTWVSIKVLDEDQNIVFFDAVKAENDGNYSITFTIPDVPAGILHVIAGYGPVVATKNLTVSEEGAVDECFIATAAFGSKFEPSVALLRAFRDKYLLSNTYGNAFVNFYYQNSPPIAAYIADNDTLKLGVRVILAPIIGIVYLLFHPVMMSIVVGLILLISMIGIMKKRQLSIRQ